jgi:NAD(P)-dependent dehydrogenase (short-subunit alcohol dehydrogenase family)
VTDQACTAIATGAARGIGASIAKRLSLDVLDLDETACKPVVAIECEPPSELF